VLRDEGFDLFHGDIAVNVGRETAVSMLTPVLGRGQRRSSPIFDGPDFHAVIWAFVLTGRTVVVLTGLDGKDRAVCAEDSGG
jgi:hypothetical protein